MNGPRIFIIRTVPTLKEMTQKTLAAGKVKS